MSPIGTRGTTSNVDASGALGESAAGLESHAAALETAARGYHKSVAFALGVSPSLIDMQCRGERPTSAERVERTVTTLRAAGSPDADRPFLVLADRLDYLTPVRRSAVPDDMTATEAAELMRAAADTLAAQADAITDGMTDDEAERLGICLARLAGIVEAERYMLRLVRERKAAKRAPRHSTVTNRRASA